MTTHDEPKTYWEPVTFKVGDRVRICVSECQREMPDWCMQVRRMGKRYGHPDYVEGRTGVVVSPWDFNGCSQSALDNAAIMGHPYWVRFDSPPDEAHSGDNFAAAELELLDEPTA